MDDKITQLNRCGMCREAQLIANKCLICSLYTCDACVSLHVNYKSNGSYRGVVCNICHIPDFDIDIIYSYHYCAYCEEIIQGVEYTYHLDRTCKATDTRRVCLSVYRKLLPNHKAKPIIEAVYNIKGIAKIIFDYYYKPRRYFESEM